MTQTKHIDCRQYIYRVFWRRMGSLKCLRDDYILLRLLLSGVTMYTHVRACTYVLISAPMVACTGQQRA
jgi:hypothetical protein